RGNRPRRDKCGRGPRPGCRPPKRLLRSATAPGSVRKTNRRVFIFQRIKRSLLRVIAKPGSNSLFLKFGRNFLTRDAMPPLALAVHGRGARLAFQTGRRDVVLELLPGRVARRHLRMTTVEKEDGNASADE